MMRELSLNVLDVAENSVTAKARLIEIEILVNEEKDFLSISIKDDGCGMTQEQVLNVTDPFFTSRTTRKVGLGIPFFKYAAESAGGEFSLNSEVGIGTVVKATFVLSHIDRMPMGDINTTIHNLIVYNLDVDFLYRYTYNENSFELDTRQFRDVLGDVPFNTPEVSIFIKEFLIENKREADGNAFY